MNTFFRHYLEVMLKKHAMKSGSSSSPQPLHPQFPDQGKEGREWSPGMPWQEAGHKHPSRWHFPVHLLLPVMGFLWHESNPVGKRCHFPSCGEQPLSPADQLISRGVPCVPWGPGAVAKSIFPIERFCLIFPGADSKSQALKADLFYLAWRVKKQNKQKKPPNLLGDMKSHWKI